MSSASDGVFSVPELLLTILLELDMRTLLSSAWRINRHFHGTIKHTSALQKALFFTPQNDGGEEWGSGDRVTQNPLLVELFPPWFQKVDGLPTDYDAALDGLPMTMRNALPAFLRSGASWRRMLVQQPPIRAVGVWEQVSHGRADQHAFRVADGWCPDGGDGLRMGALYDMTLRSLAGHADAFRVFWIGRGDVAHLERRPLAQQMTPGQREQAARLVGEIGVLLHRYRYAALHSESARSHRRKWRRQGIKRFKFPRDEDEDNDERRRLSVSGMKQ